MPLPFVAGAVAAAGGISLERWLNGDSPDEPTATPEDRAAGDSPSRLGRFEIIVAAVVGISVLYIVARFKVF